ncbi:MAG: response regulator, partial [Chloroflexota bacterium]
GAPTYDPIRSQLAAYGAGFLVSGIALMWVETHAAVRQSLQRAARLLAGGMFLLFLAKVGLGTPTAIVLYGGFGLLVGLDPWFAHRLPVVDPSSLRARSALMLVAIAALPLIGAVAIVADQGGRLAALQALAQQQTLAVALAADVDDYIRLHRAAASVVASIPGLRDLPAEPLHVALRTFSAAYPDALAFSLYAADGAPLARSDDLQGTPATGLPVLQIARQSNAPSLDVFISPLVHRPIFAFGAPLKGPGGQFGGLAVVAVESTRIAQRITQASGGHEMLAYLVDARGRVIAHPDPALVESFADLSTAPPVATVLSADAASGTLTYSASDGERLVGYASLPDFGWGVVVERRSAVALASVRTARELAFAVLLAFIGLAVVVAWVSTRWLTLPLALLAEAARRHSIGDHTAPLPMTRLTELARLASAFRVMRENVDARTAERDQAGLELRDSETRLRQLMDGVPVGIYVIDADGKPYYANTAAQQLLGRGLVPSDTINTFADKYQTYIAGTDQLYPAEEFPMARALAGEHATADNLETRRPDGVRIRLDMRASPIYDESGRIQFAMSAFSDSTERKQLEAHLRVARAEALSASRAKSAFLATMRHEIRTPMNGVIGMSGLLMDTELTDRQFEYADAVRRSGEALLAIINDILDFSKIEAGKLEIEVAPVNVQESVEDVVELLAERAHAKGLELAAFIDPRVPLGLLGDAGRIRQVLMNLVGNAVKFTEHGEVVVRVRMDEHASTSPTIRFEVTDTGIGISSDAAARLFQPFSQADSSTTRKYGGTGLGLAICRGLVERMGGTIGVHSQPGQGSTFYFTVVLAGTAAPMSARPPLADLRGLRALAVDDNATNRIILHEQLTAGGLLVTTVADGASALKHLREAAVEEQPFTVAVLDMHMPIMDGLMLAEAIHADPSIASTPMVLLTSVGEQGPANVFAASLTKPARQSQLLTTIATVLSGPGRTGQVARRGRASATDDGSSERNRPRVLVAEDTPVSQLVARRMLEKLGCWVDVAGNGREAVAAMQRIPYVAVMMDVQMPEMDGFEATAEIRRIEGSVARHTPIIAMTANALEGDQHRCLAAGMDDYVTKPVRMDELEMIVRRWVPFGDGQSLAA